MSLRQRLRILSDEVLPPRAQATLMHLGNTVVSDLETLMHPNRPGKVLIETNRRCNRRCDYCPLDASDTEMDDDTFYSIIDQLADWGFKGRVTPVGYSEPVFEPRMTNFITYINEQLPDSAIWILSNGDYLTQQHLDAWTAVGMTTAKLSIHDPSTPEQVAHVRALDAANDNVIVDDLRPGHQTLLMHNRGGLVDVGEVHALPRCYLVQIMTIHANGDVALCVHDYHSSHMFGNVHDRDIAAIWNDPAAKQLRWDINHGKYTLDMCKACGFKTELA